MGRNVITHEVVAENRDKGKRFVITEMSAVQAHKWATKALFAILNSGAEIPDEMVKMGLPGIAAAGMGAISSIPYAVAEPLLDELMGCVKIAQDLAPEGRALMPEDIEEITTIFDLQGKVLQMHISPFTSGVRQSSPSKPTTPAPAD